MPRLSPTDWQTQVLVGWVETEGETQRSTEWIVKVIVFTVPATHRITPIQQSKRQKTLGNGKDYRTPYSVA